MAYVHEQVRRRGKAQSSSPSVSISPGDYGLLFCFCHATGHPRAYIPAAFFLEGGGKKTILKNKRRAWLGALMGASIYLQSEKKNWHFGESAVGGKVDLCNVQFGFLHCVIGIAY